MAVVSIVTLVTWGLAHEASVSSIVRVKVWNISVTMEATYGSDA